MYLVTVPSRLGHRASHMIRSWHGRSFLPGHCYPMSVLAVVSEVGAFEYLSMSESVSSRVTSLYDSAQAARTRDERLQLSVE